MFDDFNEIYPALDKFERPRWERSIPPTNGDWLMWQFTFEGKVDGVEGGVDINLLRFETPTGTPGSSKAMPVHIGHHQDVHFENGCCSHRTESAPQPVDLRCPRRATMSSSPIGGLQLRGWSPSIQPR